MTLYTLLLFLLLFGPSFEAFNGTIDEKFTSNSPNFVYWANINFSFNFDLPRIAIEFDCTPPDEFGWQHCEERDPSYWWFGP